MCTARKIDISYPITGTHEVLHCPICQVLAVAKVKVVEILSKPADAVNHRPVCDIPAFGQYEVAEAGRNGNDFINALVRQKFTTGEVEDAQVLVGSIGELKESFVCKEVAVS